MKNLFKKAVTVLGSVVLIGATIGSAAAASYPSPFDAGNAAVVVGANADAKDAAAAIKIATDLGILASTTSTTAAVTGGDSYKMEKTSTKFNLGDYAGDVVSTKITNDNLPTLLADGKFIDDDNDEFDYTQKIDINNATLQLKMFEDSDYARDKPVVGIRIANGANVLNYTLDFTDNPDWADIATSNLPFMGKSYYVLANGTLTDASVSLTLLDSAYDALLSEGDSTTLTVAGKSYVVSINFIGDNEVKLTVNGETTNSLSEAQTFRLTDDAYVGIKDIMYSSKDVGVSKVEFSIGTGKLLLTNGSEVQLNDEIISGLETVIFNNTESELTKIEVLWDAEDDLFITDDSSISMPGFDAVKMSFNGLVYPKQEKLYVEEDGDDSIVLKSFPLKDSTENINILYYNTTNYTLVGKDSDNLLRTSGNTSLVWDADTDDWFVVSWNDTQDSESYLMRCTDFKNVTTTSEGCTVQYRNNGVWTDIKTDAEFGDTITKGNAEFVVGVISKSDKIFRINTTTTGVGFNFLYSKEGMRVVLPWVNVSGVISISNATNYTLAEACAIRNNYGYSTTNGQLAYTGTIVYNASSDVTALTAVCGKYSDTYELNFTEEDKNENLATGNKIGITLTDDTNTEVSVTGVVMGANQGSSTEVEETDVYRNFAYSDLATEALWDKSSDQYTLALTYHGDEVIGGVYITAPSVSLTGTTGAKTFTDAEASSYSGKNLVVVGGSCINTVAAELLGGKLCGEAFTSKTGIKAGEALINTYAYNNKVATLVAGYNADDTSKAATYLVNDGNTVSTTVGTSGYKVTSETTATLITA